MKREFNKQWISWGAFVLTFLWVLLPESWQGPAVIWPSLIAVALAFLTRDIYISLFVGAFSGAILLKDGHVIKGFIALFAEHLIPVLADPWKVCVILFSSCWKPVQVIQ